MNQENFIIRCGNCGTKNRLPRNRLQDKPRCGKCQMPLSIGNFSDRPVPITDNTFGDEVVSHPGGVLVDCWAPWCGPCRIISPLLEQLASEYAGRLKVGKLNVDENPPFRASLPFCFLRMVDWSTGWWELFPGRR
jgi:thioredoxin 2